MRAPGRRRSRSRVAPTVGCQRTRSLPNREALPPPRRQHQVGTPQFILEMVEDITDRKQAQLALLQNEAKWRSLIFNSSDIITILDESARIVYESPSVKRVLGYEPEELASQMLLDFIHPDDLASIISYLQKLIANP